MLMRPFPLIINPLFRSVIVRQSPPIVANAAANIRPPPVTTSQVLGRHSVVSVFQAAHMSSQIRPARRVANQTQDVWTIVNEAAKTSSVSPVINLGQGFFGYNPPKFVLDAAKQALDRVDCNQYSPTKGRPRLKKALADAYSPFFGRELDPETEITITTGANEGMLSAFMAFVEQGDEVIVFEPYFDQYISNIEMAGGKVVYVNLVPPERGHVETRPSSEWTVDFDMLQERINPRTRMLVRTKIQLGVVIPGLDADAMLLLAGYQHAVCVNRRSMHSMDAVEEKNSADMIQCNRRHNPIGKIFSREELQRIGDICVQNNIIILSDEVYDRLYYTPFTRIATLSPEIDNLTLTVGSAGKCFYATGWRVGWLIGRPHLITYVSAAHTRICYSSVSPLQEAVAIGLEQAEQEGFWDRSKREMKDKQLRFNAIWDELGLPYTDPEGGYFVLVNMSKVKIPEDYPFPDFVQSRPRDFKLSWFLIKELGVAAIPPTEFVQPGTVMEKLTENYLRFAVCKDDDVLEAAKERLRGLRQYMV
ncbi:putative kynurenine aminotransferase [Drechslerella dactyloides]|uniref:Kynurenine aminotransferase n=1 Tax=Drechslerella dactyloides TaxID=74499 RepID=A0AAD6NJB8_DREDA|nr:putative kynurenine aminotransferase [Drechslerella dactyloides]